MPITFTLQVDKCANVHSHLRELDVAGDLIDKAIEGGTDVLLPMPNTKEELTTVSRVIKYNEGLACLVRDGAVMNLIPTAYLSERTTVQEIVEFARENILDFKVYPRNRTTKSENGVVNYAAVLEIVRDAAQKVLRYHGQRIRIHFHPEHPSMAFQSRDAEFAFLGIAGMFVQSTEAVVIWEHGTDSRCIPVWRELATSARFWVTLTAHHLCTNEDRAFGDVRCVCKPPIKREIDRQLLAEFAMEDLKWVMAGADDAPHPITSKHVNEKQCACGAYTAPFLLPLYAHALDEAIMNKINGQVAFINFTSRNARRLYGLPESSGHATLAREPFKIPPRYQIGSWTVEPFMAGEEIKWSLQ